MSSLSLSVSLLLGVVVLLPNVRDIHARSSPIPPGPGQNHDLRASNASRERARGIEREGERGDRPVAPRGQLAGNQGPRTHVFLCFCPARGAVRRAAAPL